MLGFPVHEGVGGRPTTAGRGPGGNDDADRYEWGQRVSRARDWMRRATWRALAGSGLTAAGIGVPLTGGALAAEAPAGGSAPSQPPTSTTPAAPAEAQAASGQTTATTTTSTAAGQTPAPGPSSTAPGLTPAGSAQQPASGAAPEAQAPTVAKQRKQQTTTTPSAGSEQAPAAAPSEPPAIHATGTAGPESAPSANIAPAPQLAAGAGLVPTPLLSGSLVSMQALSFYRIPLFLLPIYQAAAAQYGVPWQVLAAINEVETDYGTDLSVSSAGAVGWMQFMPETWLQYGVDAVNAGYADPYNPVDAIFAAARYLHAAGASSDLQAAILAYNHSEAYVQSVLLRARLIASYPASVIGTLTGLTEGSLPVADAQLVTDASSAAPSGAAAPGSGSPAGGAQADTQAPSGGAAQSGQASSIGAGQPGGGGQSRGAATASLPGSTPAPAPAVSAAFAEKLASAPAPRTQLSELIAADNAPVVAVEDGRVVALGRSRKLGDYLVLRDTYGDVFTYAGLGSIVPTYHLPKPPQLRVPKGALRGTDESAAKRPAGAEQRLPLTLHVAAKKPSGRAAVGRKIQPMAPPSASPWGKVRVFAHPGNPDALAAAARAQAGEVTGGSALTRGSLVAQGTVLGHLGSDRATHRGYLRFAIRPPGAQSAIDPRPILENWRALGAALHPKGARGTGVLAGATASDAFLLSLDELERAVLSDPDIRLSACDRHQIASGRADERMLALLVFLSRSGLKPTVGQLSCLSAAHPGAARTRGDSMKITAVNGLSIAGHQGAGTIADITIRTLLTVKRPFAPKRIVSLMQYPGIPATVAQGDHGAYIEIDLPARARIRAPHLPAAAATARVAALAAQAPAVTLSSAQWRRLIARIGGLPSPTVARKPSSAAIRDPRK